MPDFLSGLNAAAPAILQALINATLLGLLLTLIVWVVLRRLPRLNAATRYGIWWLTLVVVVALPLFGFDALEHQAPPAVEETVAPICSGGVYAIGEVQRVKLAPVDNAEKDFDTESAERARRVLAAGQVGSCAETPGPQIAPMASLDQPGPLSMRKAPAPPSANATSDDGGGVPCASAATVECTPVQPGWLARGWSAMRSAGMSGWRSVATLWESPYSIPVGSVASIVLLILAGVCALFVARLAWCYARLVSLKRNSEPLPANRQEILDRLFCNRKRARRVSLRHSSGIRVPTALGLFNPVILFPTDLLDELTESEFENIVYHEYAHICRRDDWTNLLQRIFEAVFVFHPAVRLIGGQLCLQREIACDDWVIAITGRTRSYAVCLTKLVTLTPWTRRYMPAPSMLRTKSQFTRRIETLLNRRRNAKPRVSNVAVLVAAVVLFTLFFQIGRVPAVIAVFDPIQALRASPLPVVLHAAPVRHHLPAAPAPTALACAEMAYSCEQVAPLCASYAVAVEAPLPAAFACAVAAPAVAAACDDVEWADATSDCATPCDVFSGPDGYRVVTTNSNSNFNTNMNFNLSLFGEDDVMTFQVEYPTGESEAVSYSQLLQLLAMGITGDYVRSMRQSGLEDITISDLVAMRQHGVTAKYVEELRDAGMTDLTVDDAIALRSNGVKPKDAREYIKSGMSPMSVEDMITLRSNGVTGNYTAALNEAGYRDLSPRDAAKLRANGVTPDFLAGLSESGLELQDMNDAIALRCNGVSPEFVKAIQDYGLNDASLDDIVGMRANGVTEKFLDALHGEGATGLSATDLIELRANGVDPEFIGAAHAYGLDDADMGDLVLLRSSGVTAAFLRDLQEIDPAFEHLSVREIAGLRANGVTPEMVAKMHQVWGNDIEVNDMISLRTNGVTDDYLNGLERVGLADVTPDDAIELRANGVSPDFAHTALTYDFSEPIGINDIIALRANGVTDDYLDDVKALKMELSVSDVIDLRSNGVDAKFIEDLQHLDFEDLTVDQIIELRALGVSPRMLNEYRGSRQRSH